MKIEVKLNGEWREVIYVQGGYVDMYKDIDGVFASLRLKPKEEGGREGCTFTAITDIRLVDESEYEEAKLELVKCDKCGEPWNEEHKCKPKKIKKLDWKIVEFNKGNMEMAGYIAKLSNKIDEIISHLIH